MTFEFEETIRKKKILTFKFEDETLVEQKCIN